VLTTSAKQEVPADQTMAPVPDHRSNGTMSPVNALKANQPNAVLYPVVAAAPADLDADGAVLTTSAKQEVPADQTMAPVDHRSIGTIFQVSVLEIAQRILKKLLNLLGPVGS
jgi:hypothetical protein